MAPSGVLRLWLLFLGGCARSFYTARGRMKLILREITLCSEVRCDLMSNVLSTVLDLV